MSAADPAGIVAAAAAGLPARRTARATPLTALRDEARARFVLSDGA